MSVPASHSPYERHLGLIARIPVRVSVWYLLLVWVVTARSASWQLAALSLVIFTSSVLVHELGHGLVARAYGLRPRILLHAFGGWCEHQPPHTRDQDLRIVAGGPAAGLLLAAAAWLSSWVLPDSAPWWAHVIVYGLTWQNLFISLFNLLPVLPLDGGRLLQITLGRRQRQDLADHLTYQIGAVVGGVAGVAAIAWSELFLGLILLLFAWQSYQGTQSGGAGYRAAATIGGTSRPASFDQGPTWSPTRTTVRLAGGLTALWLFATVAPFTWVDPIYQYAALVPASVVGDLNLWRPFTYAWLHAPGGWESLSFSVLATLVLGTEVERRVGQRAMLTLYLTSAVAAGVIATLLGLALPGPFGGAQLGASAPAFALLFAWAWLAPDRRMDQTLALPVTPRQLAGGLLLLDVALALSSGSPWTWQLHLAGAAVGWAEVRPRLTSPVPNPTRAGRSPHDPPAVVIPLPSAEERERLRQRRNNRPPPDDTVH